MGPAKNMSKKPFRKKNERITNVFRIAEVQSTQQFGIRRLKGKRYNAGADEMKNIRFHMPPEVQRPALTFHSFSLTFVPSSL